MNRRVVAVIFPMNIPSLRFLLLASVCALSLPRSGWAQATPTLMNYQGRVIVGGTNYTGTGKFKFALVISTVSVTSWNNDGTSSGGSEPTAAVSLPVTNGLYSVLLGDTTIANMTKTIPYSTFNFSGDIRLRVWFDDGVHGSQLLSPDQRIASAGWAMIAGTVAINGVVNNYITDGSITSTKIARGAVASANLAANAVASANIASGAVATTSLADGSVTAAKIASGAIGHADLVTGAVDTTNLSINSTTKVTNLNSDLLDGLDSTDFVKKAGDSLTGNLSRWTEVRPHALEPAVL